MKIGILTWHQYHNFGSALQASALRLTLSSMGHDAHVINYLTAPGLREIGKKARCVLGRISASIDSPSLYRYRYAYLRFQRKYMSLTPYMLREGLVSLSKQYDCLICGSDQIWAPNVLDGTYMLDFCRGDEVRKVSYAASIGLPKIPEEMIEIYRKNLMDFYRISVREEAGKNLLRDVVGIDASVVLDPTFLLKQGQYMRMEQRLRVVEHPYVFCYFLNKNHFYMERVEKFASKRGLKVIGISERTDEGSWMKRLGIEVGPAEFLYLIHHAEAVFTDSYHGTIFSLLYHKDFYTFERFQANDPINQNSRIYQLDKWFGIGKRIIGSDETIETGESMDFDFDGFETKLAEARKLSMDYLAEALK